MKCRVCDDLKDQKGGHVCGQKGVYLAENRLDVDRPCFYHPKPRRKGRLAMALNMPEMVEHAQTETLPVTLCPVAENPECVEEAPERDFTAWLDMEAHRNEEARQELIAAAEFRGQLQKRYGEEAAEVLQALRRVTERRLAAIREAV